MTNMTKVVQNLMCFLLSWWNIPTLCHWKSRACRPKWKWFQQVQVDNAQKARALYSRLLPNRPFASNVPPCFCDKVSLWNNSFCVQRCFCHCDGAIVLQHVIVSLLYFDFLHSVLCFYLESMWWTPFVAKMILVVVIYSLSTLLDVGCFFAVIATGIWNVNQHRLKWQALPSQRGYRI